MNIVQGSAPPLPPELIAKFRTIVGDKYAVTDAADIAPYVTEERDLFHGRSPLVLRPGSTAEVSAICKLASEHKIALVPQGGNTGLVGGQTPHHGEVVVSLRRLDKIREIDPASNTMTCEAGVVLQIAQARASEVDRLFPLSLGAEGSCTIGGNLSTNAGGTAALAYGVAREMALGLEVVLADGRVLNGLSKLKKDNTGYDLRNLFIGAEGTLGIITAATLKLFPKPRAVETGYVGLQSPAQALKLLSIAQNEAAGSLTSFELLADIAVDFSLRHGIDIRDPLQSKHPWYVLMELSSSRDDARAALELILAKGMEEGIVDDAVIAANLTQRAGVLEAARRDVGGAEAGRRLDQARHLRAGRRRARLHRGGQCGGGQADPGLAAGAVRPSRRRQHPLQCQPADRRQHRRLHVALARGQRGRVRDRAADGRIDLRRARHRRAQARRTARRQGQGRDRTDARHQGDARSARHHEPRQGAVTKTVPPLATAPITDADVATVIALWQACGLTRPWNDPAADIALARRGPNSTILIGRADNIIVATAMVGHDGHRGWVYYVATDPDRRAKGFGRAIMDAAEDWLRAAGIAKLQLLVRRENARAGAFYQSIGYAEAQTIVFAKWLDGREPTP